MKPREQQVSEASKDLTNLRLYGVPDVCQVTGLGRTTVKNLIYDGELDSIKVGRRLLVPVESIDNFIAARLQTQNK